MRRFIPLVLVFLAEAALQVSTWHDNRVAVALLVLLAAALLYGVWPWLFGRPAFVVTIKQEVWANYQHRARILEAFIEIENTTGVRKQVSTFQMSGVPFADFSDPLIRAEVEARRSRLQRLDAISRIEAHHKATGWIVHAFAHSADPGPPEYEFAVIDELSEVFVAPPKRRGRQWPWT